MMIRVAMAVTTKVTIFWYVMPCSPVDMYQRFAGACCLHLQCTEGKWIVS
jgi:hypothetical protein